MATSPHRAVRAETRNGPRGYSEATRDKLIEVSGHVFAERGYYGATVREICMLAGSNVAAVNYHFQDKLGLYTAVLQQSVKAAHLESMRHALDANAPPEQTLRAVIRLRLQSMSSGTVPDCQFRIMAHEFAQPTPAMSRIIQKVSRPLYERFLKLVGEIIGLPAGHEKTRLCVNSVMGQITLYTMARPVLSRLWPQLKMTPEQTERIADHIADFSLAYLKEVRQTHQRQAHATRTKRS